MDEHLGCFHLFIMNNGALNVSIQVMVWVFSILCSPFFQSFWYIQRSGLAGAYGESVFDLLKSCGFPTPAVPFYIPTSKVWAFQFCLILFDTSPFLKNRYPSGCKVVPYCVLICVSLMSNDTEYLSFHGLVGHLFIIFREMSVQNFCPYLDWVVSLFVVESKEFFIYSGY